MYRLSARDTLKISACQLLFSSEILFSINEYSPIVLPKFFAEICEYIQLFIGETVFA